jgi:RNA polymerase subunit RPABC4/transcription elongation factor Spt4
MICYNCESEIESDVCPICKHKQTMTDMFGEIIRVEDYLKPLDKEQKKDRLDQKD